jgi:hypothetical protein
VAQHLSDAFATFFSSGISLLRLSRVKAILGLFQAARDFSPALKPVIFQRHARGLPLGSLE